MTGNDDPTPMAAPYFTLTCEKCGNKDSGKIHAVTEASVGGRFRRFVGWRCECCDHFMPTRVG